MASRLISDLDPRLQPLCRQFVQACEAAGIRVLIICTYRDNAEQNALFAQSRSTPPKGPWATNARGGQSPHNCTVPSASGPIPSAQAFDFAIKGPAGALDWNVSHPCWPAAGAIAVSIGLDWGGAWSEHKDRPHCQLKNWKGL